MVLTPGTKIDRYELVSLLGEGGMAQVWAARTEGKHGFRKLFALKAIHHRFADDPQFRTMFLDEARIAAEIEHPNVAQVFDLGESGSTLYLVMEYVDGESLAALLGGIAKKAGKPSTVQVATALRIAADVCSGLSAAHKLVGSGGLRGVVHRDVSPQNVLLSMKGDVKLIDFGIAHAEGRLAEETGVDSLKGKLRYMAPEQARREALGAFTDVWAVGAMLYRMLAGNPPFEAPTDVETMQLLLSGAVPTPLPDSVPQLVTAIVDRALAADPEERYVSAAEMHTALEAAIGYEGFVPDVGTFVRQNLTDRYHARRDALEARDALYSSERIPSAKAATSEPSLAALPIDKTMPSAQAIAVAPPAPAAAPPAPAKPPPVPAKPPPPVPAAAKQAGKDDIPSLLVPPKPEPVPPGPPSSEGEAVHITLQSRPQHEAPPKVERPITPIEVKITRSTSLGKADEEPQEAPRSFMDVRAIQEERVEEATKKAEAEARGEAPDEGQKPKPEAKPTKSPAQAKREQEEAEAARRQKRIVAAGAIGALLLLAVGLLLALPSIVKSRVLATAAAAGIDLTIGDVSAGVSGAELRNLTARSAALPGVEVAITEVRWTGWSANEIRVLGVDVKMSGELDETSARVRRFLDGQRRLLTPASGKGPRRVSVASVHLAWTDAFGPKTKIEGGEIGLELESAAAGTEDIKGTAGRFEITTTKTVLGPWSASFESSPKSTRLILLFDPLLPDGPSVVYLFGPGTKPHLTVKVPRSNFAQLGIRPQELGLPVEPSSEIEVRLDGGAHPNDRVDGSAKIEVHGVRVAGWKQPVDVRIEGAAAGPSGHPLELERTTANIGPFTAFLAGTVTPAARGLRLDATWKTQPILCERIARAEAKTMGVLAATIQEIAAKTGAVKVTGSAYATGTLKADTQALEAAALTFQTRETCGITLFGQP